MGSSTPTCSLISDSEGVVLCPRGLSVYTATSRHHFRARTGCELGFFPSVAFVPHRRLKIAILLLPPKCLSVELQLSMGGNYCCYECFFLLEDRGLTAFFSLALFLSRVWFLSLVLCLFLFFFVCLGFFFHVLFLILSYLCVLRLGVSVFFFLSYRRIFEYTSYCLLVRLQESHKAGASYKICVRLCWHRKTSYQEEVMKLLRRPAPFRKCGKNSPLGSRVLRRLPPSPPTILIWF